MKWQTKEKLEWIRRNYGSTFRQRYFHVNENSRHVARKYAHKWAKRSTMKVRIIVEIILFLRIDYLLVKKT